MSLWSRIANVLYPDRLNREIEEELEAHIAEAVEQGRDPREARRAIGAAVRQRQESHDLRVVGWLDSLRADLVFGWRQLKRNKLTSAAAILSLALAIGACTSAFRLIDALLLRPLPIAHPERLYVLSRQGMGFDNKPGAWDSWAYPSFQLMRNAAKGQAELIAISYAERFDVTFTTDQETEKANLQYVSGSMFPAFGIEPALGRVFSESDDRKPGTAPYVVLSWDYWSRRFGRDPHVIGRTLHIGDRIYEIIGVSEKKFTGTEPGTVVDIFIPTCMHRSVTRSDSTWVRALVVVNPGIAVEPLRARLAAVSLRDESSERRNRLVAGDAEKRTQQSGAHGTCVFRRLRDAARIQPGTGRSGRAGAHGPADRVRQCGEPDDGSGGRARQRDGSSCFDRRRALAPDADGARGERSAGFAGRRERSRLCLVVLSPGREHDQPLG